MLRKALLTTSALIVAGSLALASPHDPQRPAHTLAQIQQLQREALTKKGFVLDKRGIPVALLRSPVSTGAKSANGKAVQPSLFGKHDSFSNFSKSKNALYLLWFGWFSGNTSIHQGPYSGSFCESYSGNVCINHYKYTYSISDAISNSAAAPFSGLESASSISLGISGGKGKVAIYDNHVATASNPCATPTGAPSCPGHRIHGASGTFSGTGSGFFPVVTVRFNPVRLRKKGKYWVVPHGEAGNRLAWFAEARNWTGSEPGGDYKASIHEVINSTYGTTRYNNWYTYHTSMNTSTNGWVGTTGVNTGDWPGAFSVNSVPP